MTTPLTPWTIPNTDGCLMRAAQLDDAPAILAIYHAVSMHMTGEIEDSLDDITRHLSNPKLDIAEDTRVIVDAAGRLVGYGIIHLDVPEDTFFDLYLVPDLWDNGEPLMRALMDWITVREQAAVERAPTGVRVVICSFSHHDDAWYKRYLYELGLRESRSFYQMWIDLTDPLPAPTIPDGYTARTVTADEDWQPVFAARRDAWRDHFGYIDRGFDEEYADWRQYWDTAFHEGCWYAIEGAGEIAALCLCEPSFNDDESIGYVATLAVRRAHRQVGLGSAALRYGLYQLQALGKRSVALHVDSSSPTGAVRLYERAGMWVRRRYDRLDKELRPGFDRRQQAAE